MSYILNALKQSESQRNLGEIPHIDTAQEPTSAYRPAPRRGIGRGWAMLAGLLPVLAVGWVMMNRQPEPAAEPPAPPAAVAPNPPPPAAVAAVPAPAAPTDPQAPGLSQLQSMAGTRIQLDDQPPPARPAAPVVLELPVAAGRVTPPQASLTRERRAPPPIPQRGAEDAGQGQGAQLNGVSHWKGLPSGIQRQVRELGINAHVYSADSSARFIRAKGRSLHEGDRLTDDLQLQQITSDGIVFTYQGAPYWMRLN
ncbi:GspB domain-containing protein [Pseudomonas sp. L-22-4S-12]|uniref:general secretion pathway protein GspB n=1 Tax=Pseudomonas sp. L-22-4S-12 TaxID=2610893 RepID=UPI0013245C36|nr:general secretion pathway protein GspB [Pseudomonas sp. L-22-4S-12]MWV14684.1 GspB domain-containing protein [Pseudomonas sp. L-22-4S-12]